MDTVKEVKKQEEYIEKVKELNKGKILKYHILTMGCQLNENDSEKLCGMLEKMGYIRTEDFQEADLNLFNTCCVRENAENTLFGRLGYLKQKKLKGKDIYIAVVGCMSQQRHILEKIKKQKRSKSNE